MLRHVLAGGLALAVSGLVLATGPAAYADLEAPYARAAAIVDADGGLNNGKNVVTSWRAGTGKYCVQVASHLNLDDSVIQITARQVMRLPSIAYRHRSATCHRDHTITVYVANPHTGRPADSGFDLSVS
ncbi:hypothetical protein FH608_033565 [Nonomuraea phyllanthi]|uniref:Uncharacterized protein n=1 Tax=Nonomuraea phyllanthi TaxID=2219224 RepID=A0A5C4VZX7_9ACTN|nr:hypothetical protein [Nonomuraea phyllanthi]KAB8190971.1 hypothetical protein FH608_033565 [Nonomuraea phyllanthi]